MKRIVGLVVASLVATACGPEAEVSEAVTSFSPELASGLPSVPLTVVCSHGTCGDSMALEPARAQQAPSTLGYSTYLGSADHEEGQAVAVDSSGNAYMIGRIRSDDNTRKYVFVAKMSPTGQNIYYSYFPGEDGLAIAVDSGGNAYIVASYISGSTGEWFVGKLNSSGTAFLYYRAAPYGFSFQDIAVDSLGNAYVAGTYYSTTKNNEVAVGKLNASGSAFSYLVSFGGTGYERAYGVDIDSSGNAYVTGYTASSNFPVWNAFQSTLQGSFTSFVTKLNAAGTGLLYSTYLGGSGTSAQTLGYDIAVDGSGSAHVAGETNSAQFPVTPGALQPAFGGFVDGFVTKLSPTGGLTYSTYLGGTNLDRVKGIAVDRNSGSAYLTGQAGGAGFPITSNAFQASSQGVDAFVTQLSASGTLLYSSFLGGNSYESIGNNSHNIALDSARNVYVVGDTQSTNFPTTVYSYSGGMDAFITKFIGP